MPGCVDGWVALHERFGHAAAGDVARAGDRARRATASRPVPLLVGSLAPAGRAGPRATCASWSRRRAGPATGCADPASPRALRAVADGGRDAFYLGEFGDGLLALGGGWFDRSRPRDAPAPTGSTPLVGRGVGRRPVDHAAELAGLPRCSAAALLADELDLPADPDDPRWAHLLIEAAKAAGHDRPDVLHDGADGAALRRGDRRPPRRGRPAAGLAPSARRDGDGDTTYLCTVDGDAAWASR